MDRREFTGRALMAMLAGVTVTIAGCGSENTVAPDPPPADRTGVVENNHGHTAMITSAQQMSGGAVTLNIQGDGSHDHVLELTAEEVVTIRNGHKLTKPSQVNRNHAHVVVFNG